MHILVLSSQAPYPPHAGGALRVYGLLRGMHAASHVVDLLCFSSEPASSLQNTPIAELCQRIVAVLPPNRTPWLRIQDLLADRADMQGRVQSTDYAQQLTSMLQTTAYDLVHIESLEMAIYLPIIKAQAPNAKVIYDSFNAEYDLQRTIYETDRRHLNTLPKALYSFIQWQRLKRFEGHVCRTVDHVIAVSEPDAQSFRSLLPNVNVSIVENGIDAYATEDNLPASLELGAHALVFTGTMNYRPNVDAILWFVQHVFEQVRQAVPQARLYIVGREPHPHIRGLGHQEGVVVTGYVQDVVPFLKQAALFIVPLRMGSGTRLKLLQAMAIGCAIVSTQVGAQGIAAKDGQELVIADTAAQFATAVTQLLCDAKRREQLGQAAQQLVQRCYDWTVIWPRLLEVYKELGLG